MSAATAVRQTAEERKEAVVAAATREFAAHGYAGTSTQDIAKRVGVSQPYLFQLFGTKRDLFIAAIYECFGRVRARFETVAREARKTSDDPLVILHEMGHAYLDLVRDRDMLRFQLHAYAACDDEEIRRVVKNEWTQLYEAVTAASGADEDSIHAWFAEGMLYNVAAAVGGLDAVTDMKLTRGALWKS